MSCTLEIENLHLKLSEKIILDDINLKVEHSDFITILGPNGSGKTSILKTIMGFYKADRGIIKICDEICTEKNILNLRKKIAYLPQNYEIDRFYPILTRDIIELSLKESYLKNKKALEIIKEFNLKDLIEKPFGLLSGGEKQKVMLAMILLREPVILLLDEPNLNLDFLAYQNFLKMIEKIYIEKKITILFVTHLLTHISDLSKKVVVLKSGKIIFSGKKEDIFKKENFLEFIYD